jgi:HEAT repeat protein
LFNLAPALDDDQAKEVAAVMGPLARGQYEPSSFDLDQAHPLSRWQIRFGSSNQLRISAIGTLAQLIANHPAIDAAPLHDAVRQALRSGSGTVVAAAFDAAARLPDLDLIVDSEEGFFHPDPRVRRSAIVAWTARNEGLPADDLVEHLAADPDPNVRLQLGAVAGAAGKSGQTLLMRFADNDPDSFVRAKSAQRARGEGSED